MPAVVPLSTSNGVGTPMKRCAGLSSYGVPAHLVPLADFNRNRIRSDGLQVTCRACQSTWRRLHAQRVETPPLPVPRRRWRDQLEQPLPAPLTGVAAIRRLVARSLRVLAALVDPR